MTISRVLRAWLPIAALVLAGCAGPAPEDEPPAVQILQAEPGFLRQGDSQVEVILRGSGFTAEARVEFLVSDSGRPAEGLTIHSVDFIDSETLKVTLSAGAAAPPSILDVRVVIGQRSGSGSELFGVASKS